MTARLTYQWILLALMLVAQLPTHAQEEPQKTRILFMLDASQSMNAGWGGRAKIETAKQVITEAIDSLRKVDNVYMALRVYGHQYHYTINNCKDSRLEVGFRPNSDLLIKSKLREIKPNGITPISYSLEKVARDFPLDPDARNIVIIITDGEESCEGDPCKVSERLQANNVILKPFVVGLGYQSELKTNLDCIGTYFEANTAQEFKDIMRNIVLRILDQTTVEVQLLDADGLPTETDVNLTFYNPISKIAQYNFYHTLNSKGLPDTIEVDPINNYHLIVHSIPPIVKRNIGLKVNQHNVISIPAPQGYLTVKMTNSNARYNANIQCLVKQTERNRTIHVQGINQREKYLTGTYELEILTLPRINLKGIEVNQSTTTTIEIPEPGLLTINSKAEVYGGIFRMKDNELEKVYQLNDRILKESLLLQPGNYWVVYRDKVNRTAAATVVKKITIKSGQSTTTNL